uniref:Outer membrane protein beta-barrel domain-containing protein n=1 Tax=uncultured Desulfobacterium sp. TaxID=201089 RepID=E1YEH1_9BACT|nr:hypothetical protein N47_B20760 [uncultured Desulfobacterium sp.]
MNSERKDIDGYVRGYLYKLDYLYSIPNFGKLVPYVAAGLGGITLNPKYGSASNDFLFNYGAGLKYFITDTIALRGDVRHVLPYGSIGKDNSQNNLLCTIGLSCLFGIEKEKPKIEPVSKVKETPSVVEKAEEDIDTDGDGVFDSLDKCPDTPKGVKVDADGCPLDTDGDGVYDYQDECPGTPKGATVDCRGCWVLEGVYFDTEKWNIGSQYFPILDNVRRFNKSVKFCRKATTVSI